MKWKTIEVVEYAVGEVFKLEGDTFLCKERISGCHECDFHANKWEFCPNKFNELEENGLRFGLLCHSGEREDGRDVCYELVDLESDLVVKK